MTTPTDDREALAATDDALDWLVNWAMGQDGSARDHYFHICDGEASSCGCKYEGDGDE